MVNMDEVYCLRMRSRRDDVMFNRKRTVQCISNVTGRVQSCSIRFAFICDMTCIFVGGTLLELCARSLKCSETTLAIPNIGFFWSFSKCRGLII